MPCSARPSPAAAPRTPHPNTFATGDTDTARSLLADGYIQHNLAYGTGAGEQVAFDIFRFDENGKIAEHWDVMETIADQSTWQNQNGKF